MRYPGLACSALLQLVDGSDRCWDLLLQLHRRAVMGQNSPVGLRLHDV